jgi:SHS2 domain-containing protein
MPFGYFEHIADVGIIGRGKTLEQAFEEGAKAMFNVMVEIKKVAPKKAVKVSCSASNQEELFVEWLNALLAQATIRGMVFSKFSVKIMDTKLSGTAHGEKLDVKRHEVKTEVKAATYGSLSVGKEGDEFVARCVVDV